MNRIKDALFYAGVRAHMALDRVLVFIEAKVRALRGK
jgi:hypothetical protein